MSVRSLVEFFKIPESVRIPILGGWLYKLATKIDNKQIRKEKIKSYPLNTAPREEKVIASLTSFPARIEYVNLAIKSLMLQTYKPDRIILWLAEEQFPEKKLPKSLIGLCDYGLEIKWIHDLYGHKKYFYPIKEQKPNELIITFDDDIIYVPHLIANLIKKHNKFPNALVCERGQTLNLKKMDENPGRWETISSIGVNRTTFSMNPSPGGGCLIPPNAFYKDAINEEKIRKLAYKNDDLWYMFMCAENGTSMVKTHKYHKSFSLITGSQQEQMATENVGQNRNVIIMEGLKLEYPRAWERILTDRK